MPAIRTGQLQKSTFITPDSHYVLFYKISFGTDPVNRFGFGFNESAEMVFYRLMLHLIICLRLPLVVVELYFCFSSAAEAPFLDRTRQVYGCAGRRVKPKSFV